MATPASTTPPSPAVAPVAASAAVNQADLMDLYRAALWDEGVLEAEALFALRWTILEIKNRTKDGDQYFYETRRNLLREYIVGMKSSRPARVLAAQMAGPTSAAKK